MLMATGGRPIREKAGLLKGRKCICAWGGGTACDPNRIGGRKLGGVLAQGGGYKRSSGKSWKGIKTPRTGERKKKKKKEKKNIKKIN